MRGILGFAVAVLLLPCAAAAGDEPEAVYAKLHRATLAGNVAEVLSYASAARREELQALPGREDLVRMAALEMPGSYSVTKKRVNGRKAELHTRGVHERNGPVSGAVLLTREAGEWKVEEWSWMNMLAQASSTDAKPAAADTAMKPSAGPPPVEPISEQPVDAPTLRRASDKDRPCVIKPVMSDEDLLRCGATPPKYN